MRHALPHFARLPSATVSYRSVSWDHLHQELQVPRMLADSHADPLNFYATAVLVVKLVRRGREGMSILRNPSVRLSLPAFYV